MFSTYFPKADADQIVELSGQAIRDFLGQANLESLNDEARQAAIAFRQNPTAYTNAKLVEYGNQPDAIQYAIRIEVRSLSPQSCAQVVAKGIWDEPRHASLEWVKKEMHTKGIDARVREAGGSSFEFNRPGVDKSLPIRFLRHAFDSILDQMNYTTGTCIDARKTKTIIVSDGDSTLFDNPKPGKPLPTVGMSPACAPLVEYLKAGGVYMLASGNELNRSIERMKDGIPPDMLKRVLILANGGADLVVLNDKGEPVAVNGYHDSLAMALKPNFELDIVYLGDDGSENGNDWAAFTEVGLHRSVLVAKEFKNEYNVQLKSVHAGGLLLGTTKFLERVNAFSRQNPFQQLFLNFHGGMYGES